MKRFVTVIIIVLLCLSRGAQVASAFAADEIALGDLSVSSESLVVSVDVNGNASAFDTGVTGPCSAIAAVYDENGKMLGTGISDVIQDQLTADINITITPLPDGCTVKLFLLDSGDLMPLCDTISAAVEDLGTEAIRVVVDGKVNTFNARLSGDEWYLKPADIRTALGVDAEAALDGFASLREAAQTADVSYEHDGVLDAAYIWTDEIYSDDASGDFDRAVSLGFVPDGLKTDTGRQITSIEFRNLLLTVLGRLAPEKVTQFEANVTTYNKPLLRGEGFVMAYYAAVCVGADTKNNNFDSSKTGDNFWDISSYDFTDLFPNVWDKNVSFSNTSDIWNDYFTAAFLWSFWHSSPISGYQVFEYDEAAGSMRQTEALTVEEAAGAAVRIYDSYAAAANNVSLEDENAVNYDTAIITGELLNKATALAAVTAENMPVWKGFVLPGDGSYEAADIEITSEDLRRIANWGFNCVRIMLTYQTLFDDNVTTVNETNLKKLDALIAAAIKYNLHIDLLTFSLPGRWTLFNSNTFETTGSFDLFTNPERQAEANAVWALIAERYREIPNATLSFCPIWEAQNYDLSSGLAVEPYTAAEVASVYSRLVGTIKSYSPDRLVIYEPTSNNTASQLISESDVIKETIEGSYSNAVMISNFCEMPFVYSGMTASEGDNIDHQNHSMFKPSYPTAIYATQYHINNGSSLDMNGELAAGTTIVIYLSEVDGEGSFEITADGETLYSEDLSTESYNVGYPLSRYYPFAESDKLISVTLPSDVQDLQISYGGNWFEWSGINVTLPEQYAVERWWFTSAYDAAMAGVEKADPALKETSTIMLSPNSYGSGNTITINPDVTYTTASVFAEASEQTIDAWAATMSAYSPNLFVRFECAANDSGCIHDSALAYYDDMLSAFADYGFSWFSNDYFSMQHSDYFYGGVEPAEYKDFYLDVDMLKLLQKHQ